MDIIAAFINKAHLTFARARAPRRDMTRTVAQLIQPQSPPSSSRVRRRTAFTSSVLALVAAPPPASRAGLFSKAPSADFVEFDAPELDYSFAHPKKWLVLRNRLRAGAIASDFDTQDKASVEVLRRREDTEATWLNDIEAMIGAFVAPSDSANEGDSKLYAPPMRAVKITAESDAVARFSFDSETTTRSGYDVRRTNFGEVVRKGSTLYGICVSGRTDLLTPDKRVTFEAIVDSFVVN